MTVQCSFMHQRLTSTEATAARVFALAGQSPVRVGVALKAGITRGALRAAVASGHVVSLGHGVIAVAGPGDGRATLLERCQAHAARRPSIIFSHQTAAALLHQPLLRSIDPLIRGYSTHAARIGNLRLHEGRIPEEHIVEVGGVHVTSPLRTALDLARELPLASALIPLDAAMRMMIVQSAAPGTPDDLAVESGADRLWVEEQAHQMLKTMRYLHGARRAADVLAMASPLAESPAESASRGHLLLAGIEPLGLQVRVTDGDGIERRLDFLLAPGLAGEVDGFIKYEGDDRQQAVRKEKRRDLALQRAGIFAVHWSGEEALWRPHAFIRVVRHALLSHDHDA